MHQSPHAAANRLLLPQVNAYMFGSVPLRTYLPDGDIDLSVFCSQSVAQSMRDTWALKLQSVIEQEQRSNSNAPYKIGDVTVINAEVGRGSAQQSMCWASLYLRVSVHQPSCTSIQCNSRDSLSVFTYMSACRAPCSPCTQHTHSVQVKLLKCLVDNIVVDISFNQMGGLITLNFLEEINNLIGNSNIFKRSIILVRLGWQHQPQQQQQHARQEGAQHSTAQHASTQGMHAGANSIIALCPCRTGQGVHAVSVINPQPHARLSPCVVGHCVQVKAWCYYESRLLGAHHGLISTYALETLVLYVFNKYHETIDSPLSVSGRLLAVSAGGAELPWFAAWV